MAVLKYKRPEQYTAISHELLEAMARSPIPARHLRVYLAILRKTYGWDKSSDVIALSQLAELTSIDRADVSHILRDLECWRLISTEVRGGGRGRRTTIAPQADADRWAIGSTGRSTQRKLGAGTNVPESAERLVPGLEKVGAGTNRNVGAGTNHKRKKERDKRKARARAPRTAVQRQEANGQGMADPLPLALALTSPGTSDEADPQSELARSADPEPSPGSAAPLPGSGARTKPARTKRTCSRPSAADADADVWSMEPDVGRLLNLLSKREGSRREHEIWLRREAPKMPPYVEKKLREGFSPSGAWVATLNAFWSRYEGSDDHWAYTEARHQEQAAADLEEMRRQGVDPNDYTEDDTGDVPVHPVHH